MFDGRIPQIEGGSGSVVVVRTCVVLEGGLIESQAYVRTFVWDVIRDVEGGRGTNGPPFGRLLWPLI
jgi:hypothetical protein